VSINFVDATNDVTNLAKPPPKMMDNMILFSLTAVMHFYFVEHIHRRAIIHN